MRRHYVKFSFSQREENKPITSKQRESVLLIINLFLSRCHAPADLSCHLLQQPVQLEQHGKIGFSLD